MLVITVHNIKGNCPVHKVGDKIIIENPEIKLTTTPKRGGLMVTLKGSDYCSQSLVCSDILSLWS